jgi:hypothetical protein
MSSRLFRWISSAAAIAVLSGCASLTPELAPRERLILERQGELLVAARAGRFVMLAKSVGQDERGAQGRFEWLTFTSSGEGVRHVLIWIGPFGQSAASIEQRRHELLRQPSITAFDDQGLRLTELDQLRFLGNVVGREVIASITPQDIQRTLAELMAFFEKAASTQTARHESQLRFRDTDLALRIVFDAS